MRGPFSCFKFITSPWAAWPAAQQVCSTMGGHLARLETTDEIIWMKGFRSYYSSLSGRKGMWLGGFQQNGSDQWLWYGNTTHTPILKFDWAPGQPNDWGGAQSCLSLFPRREGDVDGSYSWDDGTCSISAPFVCEKMHVCYEN